MRRLVSHEINPSSRRKRSEQESKCWQNKHDCGRMLMLCAFLACARSDVLTAWWQTNNTPIGRKQAS